MSTNMPFEPNQLQATMEQITDQCRHAVPDFEWKYHQTQDGFLTDTVFLKCRQQDHAGKIGLALRLPYETIRELVALKSHHIDQIAKDMARNSIPIERGARYPEATITISVQLHLPNERT